MCLLKRLVQRNVNTKRQSDFFNSGFSIFIGHQLSDYRNNFWRRYFYYWIIFYWSLNFEKGFCFLLKWCFDSDFFFLNYDFLMMAWGCWVVSCRPHLVNRFKTKQKQKQNKQQNKQTTKQKTNINRLSNFKQIKIIINFKKLKIIWKSFYWQNVFIEKCFLTQIFVL